MRLGELLVGTGAITGEQRDAALRQQVVYGGRLGTNLIELGYATPDAIAHGLARLLHVPASLERHFEHHDPAAIERLPKALALRHSAFPIAFAETRTGRRMVVCLRDPKQPGAVVELSRATGIGVLVCVAPELVLLYWLERAYGIERPTRYRQAHAGASQPLPKEHSDRMSSASQAEVLDDANSVDVDFDLDDEVDMPSTLELVDLDHGDVARDFSHYNAPQPAGRDSLLDLAAVAGRVTSAEPSTPPPALPVERAVIDVREAVDRDGIADAVVSFLRGRFAAGLMLIAKEGVALGHRGFGGVFDDTTVESILVPLSTPSMFHAACESRQTFRGTPPRGRAIHDRFFKLFALDEPPRDVAVVPVLLKGRVVCLVYAHGDGDGPLDDGAVADLEDLASECGAAYLRLIKRAKRR